MENTTQKQETLGRRITARREELGMTQAQLAAAVTRAGGADVTAGTLSHWERGRHRPPRYRWKALAEALGWSTSTIATVLGEPDISLDDDPRVHPTSTRPAEVGQHVPMDDLAAVLDEIRARDLTLSHVDRHYELRIGYRGYDVELYTHGSEQFATAARMLAGLGGTELRRTGTTVEKRAGNNGLELHADHGTCHVRVVDVSSEVCKKVLVGTDVVEEQVPDPAWEGEVPMVTVTREVPRYEIVCPPSVLALADRSDETAAVSA